MHLWKYATFDPTYVDVVLFAVPIAGNIQVCENDFNTACGAEYPYRAVFAVVIGNGIAGWGYHLAGISNDRSAFRSFCREKAEKHNNGHETSG